MKKAIYIVFGCLGLGMGFVGAILPLLPSFPFLMLAAFCFARSSKKLDSWFRGTRLYRENLEDYVSGRGMTVKSKIRVIITITLLMGIGFVIMAIRGIIVGCVVLGIVWLFHILYFYFFVKTRQDDGENQIS